MFKNQVFLSGLRPLSVCKVSFYLWDYVILLLVLTCFYKKCVCLSSFLWHCDEFGNGLWRSLQLEGSRTQAGYILVLVRCVQVKWCCPTCFLTGSCLSLVIFLVIHCFLCPYPGWISVLLALHLPRTCMNCQCSKWAERLGLCLLDLSVDAMKCFYWCFNNGFF